MGSRRLVGLIENSISNNSMTGMKVSARLECKLANRPHHNQQSRLHSSAWLMHCLKPLSPISTQSQQHYTLNLLNPVLDNSFPIKTVSLFDPAFISYPPARSVSITKQSNTFPILASMRICNISRMHLSNRAIRLVSSTPSFSSSATVSIPYPTIDLPHPPQKPLHKKNDSKTVQTSLTAGSKLDASNQNAVTISSNTLSDSVNSEHEDSNPSNPKLSLQLRRIAQLARPEMWILIGALALLFISSAVSMSVPLSMGTIIDMVMVELGARVDSSTVLQVSPRLSDIIKQHLSLTTLFGVLACIFVVGGAANMGRVILMRTAAERIIARMRNNLFSNIIRQDVAFHDANRSGELISRLSADTVIVGKTLTNYMSDGLRSLVTASAGVTAMLFVNVNLTITMMMIVPPVALGAVFYGRFVRKLSRQTTDSTAEITKFAEEKISNLRTVRAFSQETREISLYTEKVQNVYKLGIKEALASGIFFGGAGLSGNLVMLAILYYGGSMVQSGEISVGELATFFLYTVYVGSSVMGLTSWYSDINKGIGASTRLFNLLESRSTIEATDGKKIYNLSGKIDINDVHFAYPTRQDVKIFDGLTLSVSSSENIAIVGHSGSGKSTITQLLMRFYDPSVGSVKIDGVDVRSLDPHWMREKLIALVPQEPVLFATTIKENIRYGNQDATDEEVIDAAKQANAHDFILAFPDGYETFVGERGHAISGGQKQRIAIARALLKDPLILVLDEATSALDAASEFQVQEAIDRLILGRTVITIAHRLSTIQKADRIIMIDNGRVSEVGTFDKLMGIKDGAFYRLVSKQLSELPSSDSIEDLTSSKKI
ncbi:hypothetical protein BDV3_005001 [Batrachochytrium dendrobatidis]